MDRATHVIDPDGEVIIVLQNANAPFAAISEEKPAAEDPAPEWPAEVAVQPAEWPAEAAAEEPEWPVEVAVEPAEWPVGVEADEPAPEWPSTAAEHAPAGPATEEAIDRLTEGPADEPVGGVAEESAAERPAEPRVAEQLEENCVRIQVSAKHLILASSVFKKILKGGWKESVTYLQEGSVEITADSWDTEALLIMLRILHCQSYSIPRKLSLEMLAKVAVLADYYDCREAVDLLASTWINALDEAIPTRYSRDLMLWLWVAWYFRLPAEFKKATATAMSWSHDWIDTLGLPIPDKIIRSIEDRRNGKITDLILQIQNIRDQLQSDNKGCGFECSSIMYGALTKQMHQNTLLSRGPIAPFPRLRYGLLVQSVQSLKSPAWCEPGRRYSGFSQRHTCSYSTFKLLFGDLNDTIEGLDPDGLMHL